MTCDVLQVVEFLLTLDLRAQKKKVQVARWQALTAFAQSAVGNSELLHRLADYKNLQLVLCIASRERFGSREIVAAMAQCVMVLALQSHPDQVNLLTVKLPAEEDDDFSYLALLKQIYVTLDGFAVRQEIVDALQALIRSKEHVKATIRAGFLRSLLQVAIDDNKSKAAQRTVDNEDDEQEDDDEDQVAVSSLSEDLMLNCAKALTHIATFVCYESTPPSTTAQDSEIADHSSELFVCELVVQLMLSGVSLVFEEGVRLLQMLVESQKLRSLLVTVVDLRGALEKASTLAQQKENKLRVQDPYLVMLCQQQYEQLRPEIDTYERANGVSLIGLPSDPDRFTETNGGSESVVTLATSCKERGNWFFRRGNFPTARAFYRRAVSLLRMAQLQKDQELATLSKQEVLRKCSAGASVQVLTLPRRVWKNAMVSDVEDGQVEVIFDDDESEEVVDPGRVRLRMATSVLDTFEAIEVDCSMNMGKAFSQLYDHERAVECFSHVLQLKRNHHVAALYHRGVAHMALHDLKSAQQDLWGANQLARKLGNEKTLLKQIVAAYKRLQLLHSNKKKMDKKIIKQMMSYLSTIPGIQEEEES